MLISRDIPEEDSQQTWYVEFKDRCNTNKSATPTEYELKSYY